MSIQFGLKTWCDSVPRMPLFFASVSTPTLKSSHKTTAKGELTATHRARDVAEDKFLSLLATAEQRRVAEYEQCERLVHELTLLSLRGSELCMTISGVPTHAPLYEGMRFVVAHCHAPKFQNLECD
jgi:hypothetical protein